MSGLLFLLLFVSTLSIFLFSPIKFRILYNGKIYIRLIYAPISILIYPSYHIKTPKKQFNTTSYQTNKQSKFSHQLSTSSLSFVGQMFTLVKCKVIFFETVVGAKSADKTAYLTFSIEQIVFSMMNIIKNKFHSCTFEYVSIFP